MKLWEYLNKSVLVTVNNGRTFSGRVVDLTSAEDNEDTENAPPYQSIAINDGADTIWELYENEITHIETIPDNVLSSARLAV